MVFANIEYLFLLLLLIPYIVWYIMKRRKNEATLQISDAHVYAHTPKSYKNYLLHVPFILRIIALILVINSNGKKDDDDIFGTTTNY